MSEEAALELVPDCAIQLFPGTAFDQIRLYADMLAEEGQVRGLLGPRELSRIWSRHIINSAALVDFLPAKGTVADIGSGAGLPGIVLAVARPDLEFTLIESMEKRCQWLAEVIEELDLDNVQIIWQRAETLRGEVSFDLVTARAVGALDKLLGYVGPVMARHGKLAVLKGESVQAEIVEARRAGLFKKFKLREPQVIEVSSPMDGSITRVLTTKRT